MFSLHKVRSKKIAPNLVYVVPFKNGVAIGSFEIVGARTYGEARDAASDMGRMGKFGDVDNYLITHPGITLELDFRKMNGVHLSECDMSGGDLRMWKMNEGKLNGCNLDGCNLTGLQFQYGDMLGASVRRAKLRGFSAMSANLAGTDFSGSDFSEASLYLANFNFCNLSGCDFSNLYPSDLKKVTFGHAKWDSSTLWPYGFQPPAMPHFTKNKRLHRASLA